MLSYKNLFLTVLTAVHIVLPSVLSLVAPDQEQKDHQDKNAASSSFLPTSTPTSTPTSSAPPSPVALYLLPDDQACVNYLENRIQDSDLSGFGPRPSDDHPTKVLDQESKHKESKHAIIQKAVGEFKKWAENQKERDFGWFNGDEDQAHAAGKLMEKDRKKVMEIVHKFFATPEEKTQLFTVCPMLKKPKQTTSDEGKKPKNELDSSNQDDESDDFAAAMALFGFVFSMLACSIGM